jgi:hypothetical protein
MRIFYEVPNLSSVPHKIYEYTQILNCSPWQPNILVDVAEEFCQELATLELYNGLEEGDSYCTQTYICMYI